jgi:23S rRNA pseudouridine955/2504/2580 synthase
LPQKRSATLRDYLIKNNNTNTVKVLKNESRGAKEIITIYSVLDYNKSKNLSLAKIELVTGRTHQIRAHMSSIGHPLLGDGKYGSIEKDKRLGYKHQALYAYKLVFGKAEDELSYLNGKEFVAKTKNIYFLREFPQSRI